jgi:hypothetical protein
VAETGEGEKRRKAKTKMEIIRTDSKDRNFIPISV